MTRTGWVQKAAAGLLVAVGVSVAAGFYMTSRAPVTVPDPDPAPPADPPAAAVPVGGVPPFTGWPQGAAPDAVLVLSGQTYGYLSPCGCSRPQKGGLERRANYMDALRAKGWYVVGVDLGDVVPGKGPTKNHVRKQDLLKYKYTMKALAEMGYAAVGIGEYDFTAQLFELLSEYALNNPGKPPIVLGGNVVGAAERNPMGQATKLFPREVYFPGGGDKGRPMVEAFDVVAPPGRPAIGVVGVVGKELAEKVETKIDKQFTFQRADDVVRLALAEMAKHPAKPEIKVMLYGGKLDLAKEVAKMYPEFQVILCQSDDALAPQFPVMVNDGKTAIVQVGHKGQAVGTVGLFRKGAGFEVKYQMTELTEEYLTPPGEEAAKKNRVLQLMEEYAVEVQKQNLLAQYTTRPLQHPSQIQKPDAKLTYIGAAKCAQCHPAEFKVWSGHPHSHAYEALDANANRPPEKKATRPSLRQYDAECVVCHTTGFEYAGGFTSEKDTPHLLNNGCENCHGPGSGHAAQPFNKDLLGLLSPWKSKPEDRLPDVATLTKLAAMKPLDRGSVKLPPNQIQVMNAVRQTCMRCHDGENDPKFDLEAYMPKVYHSGLKNAGLPPGAK